MDKKIDLLKDAMQNNNWKKAISIASKFPKLKNKDIILRAQTAFTFPHFLSQIGKNPQQCINEGIDALKLNYG